ncbi:MAG: HAMP domain-containing histidine kinase, partial [Methanospirillum sp.]|uniref:sensor histidine kinase n=1 Tax=Methanospirillum sp. TaxID=45200 RepID=UPI00236CD821
LKDTENALKMANSKLNLLSSVTRHDIMNKVMIGKSNLYLLRDIPFTAEQRRYFNMLSESLRSIEEFIAFTRTYQELGVETPVWQDVEGIFMQAIDNIDPGEIIIDIQVTGVRVYADPLFPKVCYNLIENAIRHGKTVSRITVSSIHTRAGLVIIVEDDGSGILNDEKSLIFERGYGKNTGYGLFISQGILAITRIILNETGEPGVGARFEIIVPFGRFDEKKAES